MDYTRLFDLTGHSALVIGAGSGMGREAALALGACGATVMVADREPSGLAAVCEQLGDGSSQRQLDVLDRAAVAALARELDDLDILVCTPAMNVRKRLVDYTDEEFDRVVGLNLRSSFDLIRHFGAAMAARGRGSIITFSSIRAATVEPGQGVYAATKSGLESLVRAAASEFGPAGVRVNAIRPGVVETPLTAQLKNNPEWYAAYAHKSALGRWGQPEEFAGGVVYLASPASSFVTGSVLTIDGGWMAQDGRYEPPLP